MSTSAKFVISERWSTDVSQRAQNLHWSRWGTIQWLGGATKKPVGLLSQIPGMRECWATEYVAPNKNRHHVGSKSTVSCWHFNHFFDSSGGSCWTVPEASVVETIHWQLLSQIWDVQHLWHDQDLGTQSSQAIWAPIKSRWDWHLMTILDWIRLDWTNR